MSYAEFNKARVENAIKDSSEYSSAKSKRLGQLIRKKKLELSNVKFERRSKYIDKVASKVSGMVPSSLKNRKILRDKAKVTVAVNQPVYLNDKQRFFKEEMEEERRQLFFS